MPDWIPRTADAANAAGAASASAGGTKRAPEPELGGGQSADGASARKRSLSLTRDGDARSDGTRVCSVRAVVDATLSRSCEADS